MSSIQEGSPNGEPQFRTARVPFTVFLISEKDAEEVEDVLSWSFVQDGKFIQLVLSPTRTLYVNTDGLKSFRIDAE